MKIAFYYPPQDVVAKDTLFCKYTGYDFLHQTCDNSVDVIYAASISVLPQALSAKYEFNKPLICWCWDIPYDWREWGMSKAGMAQNAFRDAKNQQAAELLRHCDLVISASKYTQKTLLKLYDIPSKQIYFYIDTHGIDAVSEQEKQNQIIQISRYFYNKKFENSIVATSHIKDYSLICCGTGLDSSYGEDLMWWAREFKPRVLFYDGIDRNDVLIELKRSKLLVSPSVFEGWGITPVEALYCKIPVLLSDLEVFREVYGDKVLYHDKNDVNDMQEKLEQLISDESSRNKMVADCQPIIAEFTPEKFAVRWKKIIEGYFKTDNNSLKKGSQMSDMKEYKYIRPAWCTPGSEKDAEIYFFMSEISGLPQESTTLLDVGFAGSGYIENIL